MASQTTPSGLITAIALIKATFDEYAGEDDDKNTLSKKEVGKLLRIELGKEDSSKVEALEFFKGLDADGDKLISFEEFVVFVASFALVVFGL